MNRRQFTIFGVIMTAVIGCIIGWSIHTGNFILPVVAVMMAALLSMVLKKRVGEVIEDERISRIFEKASGTTFKIFLPLMAVIGVVLVTLSQNGLQNFEREGYTLLYTTSALLVIYLFFYRYYNRRGLD